MSRSEASARGGRGNKLDDNVVKFKGSNDPSYILARLERDRPDILNEFHQGAHKSAGPAGIAAGIIKVPSNYEQAIKAIRRLTPDEILMLKDEVRQMYHQQKTKARQRLTVATMATN